MSQKIFLSFFYQCIVSYMSKAIIPDIYYENQTNLWDTQPTVDTFSSSTGLK